MSSGLDALVHRLRPAAAEPEGALILTHGRGADESDLLPLLDALDPERRLVGAVPRAPLQLPPMGYHWYVSGAVGHPDKKTFLETCDLLGSWLEAWAHETGVPIERTILGGFSQGTVMAYALGLGRGRPQPAGLVAFSGFLPEVDGFELDLEDRSGLPVAMGHGTYDDTISVDFGRAAKARLEAAGAAVTYRESPMPHAIDPGFLRELPAWVRSVIAGAANA